MKKFLAVVLAGAMVLAMAGCSGGSDNSGESAASDSSSSAAASGSAESSAAEGTAEDSAADTSAAATADAPADDNVSEDITLPNPMKPDLLSAAIQNRLGLDESTATAAAEQMITKLMYTQGNPARIAKVLQKLQNGEEVTVAFLGGSITQGTGADNENCYPNATVNYVNAGIGATGSYIGVHRCDTQVLSKNPDLVFIDFSVNDESQNNNINKLTYEGLIRKIWQYTTAPGIICIAMTQDTVRLLRSTPSRSCPIMTQCWISWIHRVSSGRTFPMTISTRT